MPGVEELKLSILNQLKQDKETILPLLIDSNRKNWSAAYYANTYRNCSRYACREFEMDIAFYCTYVNEKNIDVQVTFLDVSDTNRDWDKCAETDISSRKFMPKSFYQEVVEFKDNKVYFIVKYFEMEFHKNKFIKKNEDDLLACIYDFRDKEFTVKSPELMLRMIRELRDDEKYHIYVDVVLPHPLEESFKNEISRSYLSGKERTQFYKKLLRMDPTSGISSMSQIIEYLMVDE